MIDLLRANRSRQAQEQLLAANLWEQTGLVFTTDLGQPVDPRNLLRTVRLACERVGLPEIGVQTRISRSSPIRGAPARRSRAPGL